MSENSNTVLWARRFVSKESEDYLRSIGDEVVGKIKSNDGQSWLVGSGLGVSAVTSAVSKNFLESFDGGAFPDKRKSYESVFLRTARNMEGKDESLFAQLGGAVIFRRAFSNRAKYLVALEVIGQAREDLKQERLEFIDNLDVNDLSLRPNYIPHVSLVYCATTKDALLAKQELNGSDAPALWVDLSPLNLLRTDRR